jgi:hypothetical protein
MCCINVRIADIYVCGFTCVPTCTFGTAPVEADLFDVDATQGIQVCEPFVLPLLQ